MGVLAVAVKTLTCSCFFALWLACAGYAWLMGRSVFGFFFAPTWSYLVLLLCYVVLCVAFRVSKNFWVVTGLGRFYLHVYMLFVAAHLVAAPHCLFVWVTSHPGFRSACANGTHST